MTAHVQRPRKPQRLQPTPTRRCCPCMVACNLRWRPMSPRTNWQVFSLQFAAIPLPVQSSGHQWHARAAHHEKRHGHGTAAHRAHAIYPILLSLSVLPRMLIASRGNHNSDKWSRWSAQRNHSGTHMYTRHIHIYIHVHAHGPLLVRSLHRPATRHRSCEPV